MNLSKTKKSDSYLVSVFLAWFISRFIVIATMWFADLFALNEEREFTSQGFQLWDAGWYQQLISVGYNQLGEEAFRFFPGFVFFGKLLKPLVGGDAVWASVLIANLFSLITFIFLYRLVIAENGSPNRAKRTVWLLALSPAAFVLVWGYAESFFIALTLIVFLALKKQNWKMVALFTCLAGLTRPTGALLSIAVVAAPGFSVIRNGFKNRFECLVASFGGPIGVLIFLLWSNSQNEKNWIPFTVQKELRGGFVDPIRRFISGVKEIVELDSDGLHVLVALGLALLLVTVWRNLPRHYFSYALVSLLVATSAENLNSLERYAMTAFPFVMALAIFSERKHIKRMIYPVSAVCLVVLTSASFMGHYVP